MASHRYNEIGPATGGGGAVSGGSGGRAEVPDVSDGVDVTLDGEIAGVDTEHDRGHVHGGLAAGDL